MPIRYYTMPSPAHLSNYVRFYWVLESDNPAYIHRGMADTCPEFIFHYRGRFDEIGANGKSQPSFWSGIQGQSVSINRFSINEPFGIFGAYLYPYAVPALFGLPASELTGYAVGSRSLLGDTGQELEEKIIQARDNKERARLMTQFLTKKLQISERGYQTVFGAVDMIIKHRGLITVADLAEKFCLSERQFERKFRVAAGITPKLFSRIERFHASVEHFGEKEQSLTEIAHACGYYDQSHFIQDFKEFSGFLPGQFFSGNAEGTEWRAAN